MATDTKQISGKAGIKPGNHGDELITHLSTAPCAAHDQSYPCPAGYRAGVELSTHLLNS